MNTSLTSAQIEQLRRDAKRLARDTSVPLSSAQNLIATSKGFRNWSLLMKHSAAKHVSTPVRRASPDPCLRYYVHGDQTDTDTSQYYCAQCDRFVEAEHFLKEHGERTYERALQSIESWNRRASKNRYQRPSAAVNILLEEARRRQAKKEAARSPFHRWLEKQAERNDHIGDLARDVISDREFPVEENSLPKLRGYLYECGAIFEAMTALETAWGEFSRAG
jgi:uncharacterized protein YozE (UPF0346 family)